MGRHWVLLWLECAHNGRGRNLSGVVGSMNWKEGYGVRPSRVRTFKDQLGLVRSPKSKIEDGSHEGTWQTLVTAVADFRLHAPLAPQLILELALFFRPVWPRPSRRPTAQNRVMPTSVVAANGLLQQKSDCETFVSAPSAAAPRSTDVDARDDISEVMTSACAECARGRGEHVLDDPSLQRACFVIPACQAWSTCSFLPL